jgi:uncharacterized protein (DUF362 family)
MHQTTTAYQETEHRVVVAPKDQAIRELPVLIEQAGFQVTSSELVLVKPNVCGMYPPALDLLRAVLRYLQPHAQALIIGETPSASHSPTERFKSLGIQRLAEDLGVATRDLMDDPVVRQRVPTPHALSEMPLPATVVAADLLVNVPGVGTHGNTLLTCALKNLFGLIAERHKYARLHPKGVSQVVADVYQLVKPHLTVVDCGRHVLVGTDALSVDVVACEFASLTPSKVRHLVLAAQDLGVALEDLQIHRIDL